MWTISLLISEQTMAKSFALSVSLLLFLASYICILANRVNGYIEISFTVIGLLGLLLGFLLRERRSAFSDERYGWLHIFLIVLFLGICSIFFLSWLSKNIIDFSLTNVLKNIVFPKIRLHWNILIILLFCSVIYFYMSGSEPRWDTRLLLTFIDNLTISDYLNADTLANCGHISMAYSFFGGLFAVLFRSVVLGQEVLVWIMLMGSILSVNGLLMQIISEKKYFVHRTLLVLLYACSPFILSMSAYPNYDIWMVLLFPILVWSAASDKWAFHFFISYLFIFSKETAIVSYAMFALGYLIYDLVSVQPENKIKYIINSKKYYAMFALGISWLLIYLRLPHWGGEEIYDNFNYDYLHILDKIKNLYILNFNWVFTIIIILSVMKIAMTKRKRVLINIIPIAMSNLGCAIFLCIFLTVNHARYNDSHSSGLILLAIILFTYAFIKDNSSNYLRYFLFEIAFIIVLFIENFVTVDFFTRLVYDKYNVGDTVLVSTCRGEYISDSMVYNYQAKGLEKVLNSALRDIVSKDNSNIFIQMKGHNGFFIGGGGFNYDPDSPEGRIGSWSSKKQCALWTDIHKADFEYKYTFAGEDFDFSDYLQTGDIGYYIYLPCVKTDIPTQLERDFCVNDVKTFEEDGWIMRRIQFVMR